MKRTLIVVAMHDGLSTMYLKTASRFGSIDGVIDLPLRYDMTLQEYSEQFLSIVNKTNNILVLTDLMSGACTVALTKAMQHFDFALVSGTNLAMLLEAIDLSEEMDCYTLADAVKKTGISDIQIWNELCKELENAK